MITDPLPRVAARRADYAKSDLVRTIALPDEGALRERAGAIEAALSGGGRADVERACVAFAALVADAQGLPAAPVAVLGVRPHRNEDGVCVYEKFGDYDLATARIRVWMKTAQRRKVTAFGTLLATLCHELCHHQDVVGFRLPETPHTRGFFERAGLLYHHARGTPPRQLQWVKLAGGRYRIDWPRTMSRAR